jgi:putative transposase
MSRPLRIELAGGLYHVTARGNERKPVFRDSGDRQELLEILAQVCSRCRWRCYAYCLMDNHYHLVVETLVPSLARGMRQLNGVYAKRFNSRHRRVGHLFQGRYASALIERHGHLLEAIRYTLLNPVRAGIVDRPAHWKWSSCRQTLGLRLAEPWLARGRVLALFASDEVRATNAFARFLEEASGVRPEPSVSGSPAFVAARLGERVDQASVEVAERQRVPEAALAPQPPYHPEALYEAYRQGLSMRDDAGRPILHRDRETKSAPLAA